MLPVSPQTEARNDMGHAERIETWASLKRSSARIAETSAICSAVELQEFGNMAIFPRLAGHSEFQEDDDTAFKDRVSHDVNTSALRQEDSPGSGSTANALAVRLPWPDHDDIDDDASMKEFALGLEQQLLALTKSFSGLHKRLAVAHAEAQHHRDQSMKQQQRNTELQQEFAASLSREHNQHALERKAMLIDTERHVAEQYRARERSLRESEHQLLAQATALAEQQQQEDDRLHAAETRAEEAEAALKALTDMMAAVVTDKDLHIVKLQAQVSKLQSQAEAEASALAQAAEAGADALGKVEATRRGLQVLHSEVANAQGALASVNVDALCSDGPLAVQVHERLRPELADAEEVEGDGRACEKCVEAEAVRARLADAEWEVERLHVRLREMEGWQEGGDAGGLESFLSVCTPAKGLCRTVEGREERSEASEARKEVQLLRERERARESDMDDLRGLVRELSLTVRQHGESAWKRENARAELEAAVQVSAYITVPCPTQHNYIHSTLACPAPCPRGIPPINPTIMMSEQVAVDNEREVSTALSLQLLATKAAAQRAFHLLREPPSPHILQATPQPSASTAAAASALLTAGSSSISALTTARRECVNDAASPLLSRAGSPRHFAPAEVDANGLTHGGRGRLTSEQTGSESRLVSVLLPSLCRLLAE